MNQPPNAAEQPTLQQGVELDSLVQQCLTGDRKAQYELYKRYNKAMFSVCYRMVGDYNEAQDVLQDAFVSAFRFLHSYKGESSFGAWLKRIVINASVQHLKKKRLDVVPLEDRHARQAADDDHPAGLSHETTSYEVDRVRRAVQQLPEGYRAVLTLYLFEGYDHQEVADILGITEGTSKSQYNRAKARLKQYLEEQPK